MGRIRKQAFVLRLTAEEMARLNKMVKQSGLSREEYIRQILKGYKPQTLPTDEINQMLDLLRDIAESYRNLVSISKTQGIAEKDLIVHFKTLCDEILQIENFLFLPQNISKV